MAPEASVEFTELEAHEFEVPCDYGSHFDCGPAAARWVMTVRCDCGHLAHRLACGGCKNIWLSTEDAAICGACGEVYAPARYAFTNIEWLR